jgi:hypothetical protein
LLCRELHVPTRNWPRSGARWRGNGSGMRGRPAPRLKVLCVAMDAVDASGGGRGAEEEVVEEAGGREYGGAVDGV